jgi:large subunit ribosomal protein L21
MYAVIKTGGKQYAVTPGDRLFIEKLNVEPGAKVEFDRVLYLNADDSVQVGTPYLDAVRVFATAVENGKAKKVIAFKYKAKKDYRKKRGHRQPYTLVEINSVTADGNTVGEVVVTSADTLEAETLDESAETAAVEAAEVAADETAQTEKSEAAETLTEIQAEKPAAKRAARPKAEKTDATDEEAAAEKPAAKRAAKPKAEKTDAEAASEKPAAKRAARPKAEKADAEASAEKPAAKRAAKPKPEQPEDTEPVASEDEK